MKRRTIIRIVVYGILLVAVGCVAWTRFHQPKPVFVHFGLEDYELKVIRCSPEMESLSEAKKAYGDRLVLAMNGGIFYPSFKPLGHLVIEGHRLSETNRSNGEGNFYLKPNGVFYVNEESAGIVDTEDYQYESVRPETAIQSGPLLINNGKIHPRFNPTSPNKYSRNGIGIKKDGQLCFGFFEKPCNLFDMAEAFQKEGCESALYLDGAISGLVYEENQINLGRRFSTMILLLKPEKN